MHVGELVVERAVAAVQRQAFDDRVQHVAAGLAACLENADLIGHDHLAEASVVIAVGVLRMGRIEVRLAPDALHVDIEQGGHAVLVGAVASQQVPAVLHFNRSHVCPPMGVGSPVRAECHLLPSVGVP